MGHIYTEEELNALGGLVKIVDTSKKRQEIKREEDSPFDKFKIFLNKSAGLPIADTDDGAIASFFKSPRSQTDEEGKVYQTSNHNLNDDTQYQALENIKKAIHQNRDPNGERIYGWLDIDENGKEKLKVGVADEEIVMSYGRRELQRRGIKKPRDKEKIKKAGQDFFTGKKILFDEPVSNAKELEANFHGALGNRTKKVVNYGRKTKNDFAGATEQIYVDRKIDPKDFAINKYFDQLGEIMSDEMLGNVKSKVFRHRQNWETREEYNDARNKFEEKQFSLIDKYRYAKIKDEHIYDLKSLEDISTYMRNKDGDGIKSFSPRGGGDLEELMVNSDFREKVEEVAKAIDGADLKNMSFKDERDYANTFFSEKANNLTSMGKTAFVDSKNMTKKQKSDFLQLMEIYSHTNLTTKQVSSGVAETIVDPTTWLSAGTATLASKTIGKQALKKTVQKMVLKKVAKEEIEKEIKKKIAEHATIGAITDGAATGAGQSLSQEKLIGDAEGKSISIKKVLEGAAAGAIIGTVFAKGISKITGADNSEKVIEHFESLTKEEQQDFVKNMKPEQQEQVISELKKMGEIKESDFVQAGELPIGKDKSEKLEEVKTDFEKLSKVEQDAKTTLMSLPTKIKDNKNKTRGSKEISLQADFKGDARRQYEIDHPLSPKGGLGQAGTLEDGKVPTTEHEVLKTFERIDEALTTKEMEKRGEIKTTIEKRKNNAQEKKNIIENAIRIRSQERKNLTDKEALKKNEDEITKLEILHFENDKELEQARGIKLPNYKKKKAVEEFANDRANKIKEPSVKWKARYETEQEEIEKARNRRSQYKEGANVFHLKEVPNVKNIIEEKIKKTRLEANKANLDIIKKTNNQWERDDLLKNDKGHEQFSTMKVQHYWERQHDVNSNLTNSELQYREYRRLKKEENQLDGLDVKDNKNLNKIKEHRDDLTRIGETPEEIKIKEKKKKTIPTKEQELKREKAFIENNEQKQQGMLSNIERVRNERRGKKTRRGSYNPKITGEIVYADSTRKLIKSGYFSDNEIMEAYAPTAKNFEEQEQLKKTNKQKLIKEFNKRRAEDLGVRIDVKPEEYDKINVQMHITDTSNSMGQSASAALGDSKLAKGTNLFNSKHKQDIRTKSKHNEELAIEDLMEQDDVFNGVKREDGDIKKLWTPIVYDQGEYSAVNGIMQRHNVGEKKAKEIYQSFSRALKEVAPKLYEFRERIHNLQKLGKIPTKIDFKILGEKIHFDMTSPKEVKVYVNGKYIPAVERTDVTDKKKRGLVAAFLQSYDAAIAKRWAKEGIRAIHDAPLENNKKGLASKIHKEAMLEAWKGDEVNDFLKVLGDTGKPIEKDILEDDNIILKSKHSMSIEHQKGENEIEKPRDIYSSKLLSDEEIILESAIRKNIFKLDYGQYVDRLVEQSRSLQKMTKNQLEKANRVEQVFELARETSNFEVEKMPKYIKNGYDFSPIKIKAYKKAFYDSRAKLEASTATREKIEGKLIFFDEKGLPISPDKTVAKKTMQDIIDEKEREYFEQMQSLPQKTKDLLSKTGDEWQELFDDIKSKRIKISKNKKQDFKKDKGC